MEFMKRISLVLVAFATIHVVSGQLSEEEIKRLTSMPGHMKPLGSEGPFFEVYSVEGFPTPRDFFNKYVIPSTPVVMKNAARLSPAFTKWTDEYLINHPASEKEEIFAEGRKKEIRTEPGFTMSFKKFVQTYNESDIYMVHGLPKHMRGDMLMPSPLLCDPVAPAILDTVTWFSSGGTKSVLHNDDVDNINCLFRGSKKLIFLNPHDDRKIWSNLIDHPEGSYSSMDVDAVDYTKFPDLADIRYAQVDMVAGDCLYIPYFWYHQVNSFGSNLAVNLWWKHLTTEVFDLTDEICGDWSDRKTLANFTFPGMEEGGGYGGEAEAKGEQVEEEQPGQASEEKSEEPSQEGEKEQVQEEAGEQPAAAGDGITKVEAQEEIFQEKSLTDKIYEAVTRVKKAVQISGLKKYVMKKYPDTIQNWDDRCQDILINYYGMLDQNKDTMIDHADAEIYYKADEHTRSQYNDVTYFFQEDLSAAMRQATLNKEKELVQKLLDRGDLDKEQIARIFGDKMMMAGMGKDEL